MFSQFKNALESVAQQPIRVLDTASSPEFNGDAPPSSLDMQGAHSASLSSSQLAESAVASIRKSFVSQRVSPAPDSVKSPSPAPGTRKSTLEERLRRAARAPATIDTACAATESITRGRSDSVASQTNQTSRVSSSSPATRGRPADVSKSTPNKVSSRIASGRLRAVEPPGLGNIPRSRSSSPAPVSKPPSRTSSLAPTFRNTSSVPSLAPTPSQPPSRSSSPTPATRTRRASELATQGTRAASPSPLTRHPSPLRRSSILVKNVPFSGSSITTPSSTDPDVSKAGLVKSPKEGISPLIISDEGEKRESDSSTAGQLSNSQEADSAQPSSSLQSNAGLSDNAIDPVIDLAVTVEPSEPGIITSTPSQVDRERSIPQSTGIAEENVVAIPEELQSTTDSSFASVTQTEPSEANLRSSGSKPNMSAPESATAVSESPKLYTSHQETKQPDETTDINHSAEIERLQARLKEVEQRFSDVSTSFQQLHIEKLAADAILKENSPLESFNNAKALRDYFADLRIKDEVFEGEIKRLTGKLELQDDRLQELRETHGLETQALSEELRKMKSRLKETEILFEAAQRATTTVEKMVDQKKEEISRLEKELEQSKNLAKEEEEKRVKAITLLKTVRQKLVKAEKDREDLSKEMSAVREREKGGKDKDQAEKQSLIRDLEISHSSHAQEIASLKAQFEKDLTATREHYEKEFGTLTGQHELDLATIKTSYNKELISKSSRISTLENSLDNITRDKNAFFDQLQLRQGELESAQAHSDAIQHQNTELKFQLRETNDRFALVREEYSELQMEVEGRSREPTVSAEEIARVVSAMEVKYEARLAEIKRNIPVLEQERHESDVDWSKKLTEKVRELEDLKKILGSATRMREKEEKLVADLKTELEAAQETNKVLQRELAEVTLLKGQIEELERSSKEQEHETNVKIRVLEKQIDEHKAREAQLKQGNRSLREELRKVQSSAALLERQRNPGVGHWGTPTLGGSGPGDSANSSWTDLRSSPSPADTPSRSSSSAKSDEEVNFEYVRNVVLQFLEHKERRPQLVKVLSILLHLTPQETRRLIAKV